MKKLFWVALILSLALLSACNGLNLSKLPTAPPDQVGADQDLATRVGRILTSAAATQGAKITQVVPTATPGEKGAIGSDLSAQPTDVPTATLEPSPTQAPTDAPTLEPTATTIPTEVMVAATEAPTATLIPTAVVNITPIALSTADPHTLLGTPTSSDSMDSPTAWTWPTGADDFSNVQWVGSVMRMTSLSLKDAGWRLPTIGPFGDIYIEMTAHPEACATKDNYGIIFHVPDKNANAGFWFVISCDGNYRLAKWSGNNVPTPTPSDPGIYGSDPTPLPKGVYESLINWTPSQYIRRGVGQPNRLGVLLKGDKISLYVNGHYLNSVHDASYPDGYFGVFINGKVTPNFIIDVDQVDYWNNPQ